MTPQTYVLLFAAGIGAGVINTVGGGGSILTLPAMIILGGMPGTVANATNRIGIVVQNIVAVWRFQKGEVRETHLTLRVVGAGVVGVALGAWLAARIPDRHFNTLLGVLMLALLALVLAKPKPRLLKEGEAPTDAWSPLSSPHRWAVLASFFVIGIYAGFIQAGAGIMILVALGWLVRLDLVKANYVKLVFILVQNALALGIFMLQGVKIEWLAGLALTSGQAIGALAGSWVAIKKGERWILVILTVSILASSAELLGVFRWIRSLF